MTARPPVVAIDGPAASGKGTLARRIAEALGFDHLDTGALYRAVAVLVLRAGESPDDAAAAAAAARRLDPADAGVLSDPDLRSGPAGAGASKVAAVPEVRAALLDFQRRFAAAPPGGRGAVLDGRDIGSVVCPDATAKLFVTADVQVRAERRWKELQARGGDASLPSVLADMQERDARDSRRAVAPLTVAAGAFVLDTSSMNPDQAFETALSHVRGSIAAASG